MELQFEELAVRISAISEEVAMYNEDVVIELVEAE